MVRDGSDTRSGRLSHEETPCRRDAPGPAAVNASHSRIGSALRRERRSSRPGDGSEPSRGRWDAGVADMAVRIWAAPWAESVDPRLSPTHGRADQRHLCAASSTICARFAPPPTRRNRRNWRTLPAPDVTPPLIHHLPLCTRPLSTRVPRCRRTCQVGGRAVWCRLPMRTCFGVRHSAGLPAAALQLGLPKPVSPGQGLFVGHAGDCRAEGATHAPHILNQNSTELESSVRWNDHQPSSCSTGGVPRNPCGRPGSHHSHWPWRYCSSAANDQRCSSGAVPIIVKRAGGIQSTVSSFMRPCSSH